LISKLQIDSQKSGTDTSEQKTLNTAIDPVIEKEELLVNQQSELNAQVNLSFAENKALLRSLLVLEDSDIGTNPVQRPGKLANPVLPDTPEKLMQVQQTETLITKLESEAEQSELLEQDVQIAPGNLLNPGKVENVASNNDIKNILNLTDSKLDKVLENIAQRVLDSKKTDEAINSEQIAQQVIPKSADIISSVESSSKEFVSMLKSGLEEYKNQLSQGREPGIDLKALISEALAKSTESGVETKSPVNLEQIVNSVSQVLDFAKTMNRAIEHHHDQVYSANSRDAAQVQGEQSKQIQLNQFESKFEKAINISKPEGHQQLAEKVRWMVNTKNLVAEIRLDPAELGSVHIKVAVSGESATVNFLVQSQQARDAVDTATPRLKEMLAEKGIELGQSSVRQESSGQQDQGDAGSTSQGGRGNDEAEDVDVSGQVLVQHNIVNGALGGIDYFV
jgi:flagellar hook-length control protein FliK